MPVPTSPGTQVLSNPASSGGSHTRSRPAHLVTTNLTPSFPTGTPPLMSPLGSAVGKRASYGRSTSARSAAASAPIARVWMLIGALLLVLSGLLAMHAPRGATGAALRSVGLQAVAREAGAGVDEAPPDRRVLGRASWTAVHTLAANFPEVPTKAERESARAFVQALAGLYPCKLCRYHFDRYVSVRPPDVSSRERFLLWTCEAHNEVSRRNRKPVFPCELARLDKRWSDCGCH